jgi:hypothetical protein
MFFTNKGIVNCGFDAVGNMLQWLYKHNRN